MEARNYITKGSVLRQRRRPVGNVGHVHGVALPRLELGLVGGEFIRRKGDFDLVASVNFGFYSPPDGTYLGKNKNPAVDADYVQFRDLNLLAFDLTFLWHHEVLPWLSLVYGAGLGLGIELESGIASSDFADAHGGSAAHGSALLGLGEVSEGCGTGVMAR